MSSSELILPQQAIILPRQLSQTSLMTYVKSVSSIIGSSNVLAIFDNGCNVKLYLKSEKHVSLLVNQGLTLHGQFCNADYALPRGDKVVLSNVDPIIPDDELVNLLNSYGTLVSELMYRKPFTECEYSHIKSDVRYAYMNIFDIENFPSKLDWMLNDIWYEIHVTVEKGNKVSSPIYCMPVNKPEFSHKSTLPLQSIRNTSGCSVTNNSSNLLNLPENVILAKKRAPKSLNKASLPVISSVTGKASINFMQDSVSSNTSNSNVSDSTRKTSSSMRTLRSLKSKSVSDFKTKRGAYFSKNSGNPHPLRLKKILRNIPPEVQSGYPMSEKDLGLFFKQIYHNRKKIDVVFSILKKKDRDTLESFKCQLKYISNHMGSIALTKRVNRVIFEIDAYLANQHD